MPNLIKLIFFVSIVSFAFVNNSNANISNQQRFLSKVEQADIADYLNGICGDTFCAGDYKFRNIGIFCDKICVVYYDVSPISKNDFFSTEDFYASFEDLRYMNTSDINLKLYKARTFTDFNYGVNAEIIYFENIKVTGRCVLKDLPYGQSVNFALKKDAIYNAQLSCVDEMVNSMREIQSFLGI
jgi:hypothetical protein